MDLTRVRSDLDRDEDHFYQGTAYTTLDPLATARRARRRMANPACDNGFFASEHPAHCTCPDLEA